jgi:prefoldin subunit 5
MDLCKNKKERLESAIETLTDELADMKTLGKIRSFFPSLLRVQNGKIRQAIKSARKTLPNLYKIETIYNGAPSESPEPI